MANDVNDQIIVPAFEDLGVIEAGGTISTTVRDSAFLVLNQIVDGLSAEEAVSQVEYHQTFTITAGTNAYTVGTSGTLVSTARPVRITGWSSFSGNFRNGGKVVSFAELRDAAKDAISRTSILAEVVAADQNYPLINIEVFPMPATGPGSLRLDYFSPITQFALVTTTLTLPDGYVQMLRALLAVALYPRYARVSTKTLESLAAAAQNAKGAIATKNAAIMGAQQAA